MPSTWATNAVPMQPLHSLAYAVMIALSDKPAEVLNNPAEKVRYEQIADEIELAVEHPDQSLPFVGPASSEASAVILAVTAAHESHYAADIQTCQKKGDHDRSITLYQLYKGPSWAGHSETEICSDPVLAARLSLDSLNMFVFAGSTLGLFRGYASGNPSYDWWPASRANRLFTTQLQKNGLVLTKIKGQRRLFADFVNENPIIVSYAKQNVWFSSVASRSPRLECF